MRPLHWGCGWQPYPPLVATVRFSLTLIGNEKKQTVPHRRWPPSHGTHRRSVVAILQTIQQGETTRSRPNSGCLAVITTTHNARGPRHIRHWTPPHSSPRLTRGPRHARLSTPGRKSVYKVAARMKNCVAPLPSFPTETRATPAGQQYLVHHPRTASTIKPANQAVVRTVFR